LQFLIAAIICTVLIAVNIFKPKWGYVVASFIAELMLYKISKIRNAKRRIDINLAFKEIPPE